MGPRSCVPVRRSAPGIASIVPCQGNILRALRGEGVAETTGQDNLRTVQLVFAAYDSARDNKVIELR